MYCLFNSELQGPFFYLARGARHVPPPPPRHSTTSLDGRVKRQEGKK